MAGYDDLIAFSSRAMDTVGQHGKAAGQSRDRELGDRNHDVGAIAI